MLPWFGWNLHKKSVLKQQSWWRRQRWCDDFHEELSEFFHRLQSCRGFNRLFRWIHFRRKSEFGKRTFAYQLLNNHFHFSRQKSLWWKSLAINSVLWNQELFHRRVNINTMEFLRRELHYQLWIYLISLRLLTSSPASTSGGEICTTLHNAKSDAAKGSSSSSCLPLKKKARTSKRQSTARQNQYIEWSFSSVSLTMFNPILKMARFPATEHHTAEKQRASCPSPAYRTLRWDGN